MDWRQTTQGGTPESFGRKLDDRHDPDGPSVGPVQVIERMGEAVVVQCPGFRPSVAELARRQTPNPTWGAVSLLANSNTVLQSLQRAVSCHHQTVRIQVTLLHPYKVRPF